MTSVAIQKANGYAGASFPNEGSLFFKRKDQPAGVGPGIICLHGRGGTCLQWSPYHNKLSPGYFSNLLALEGFRVLAIDDMGGTDWGSQDSTARISDAVTYLRGALGAKSGKVGVLAWSMGGCAALNWIDQNSADFGCGMLFSPCSDLEWAHSQSAWTAEIDAAYTTEGTRTGNNPSATPANYRGVGPIRLVHATDDPTIPVAQSQSFVAAVNDAQVQLEQFSSGGHSAFSNLTDLEVVAFFRATLGAPTA